MKPTSLREIKLLLQKNLVRPIKSLGQHFLIDKEILKKIIEAADLNPKDTVLEIGPGIGTLTLELAKRAKKVVAIEKDQKMVEILKENLKDFKNTKIILGDILKINTRYYIQDTKYKIVANLPYYITSPVIRRFLECNEARPRYMVLMVQKEVAQRICAKPPEMNLLAVSVQFYAKPEIISFVSKKSFWPCPKVDSAIIKLKVKKEKLKINRGQFFRIVRAGFSQPRKQILNNLSKGLALSLPKGLKLKKPSQILREKTWVGKEKIKFWLEKNKIKPTQRAETLSIEDWITLTKNYKKYFK